MTTSISAASVDAAGNISSCIHLTDYRHNTIPPADPVFSETIPVSPTNQTMTPLVLGYPSENTNMLNFFLDAECLVPIGSGNAVDFEQTGVQVTVPSNTNSSIYVTAQDLEGNNSECLFLASYFHSVVPANNVGFSLAFPASPTRVTANPYIVGSADSTIVSVGIYSDASCSTLLGSGLRISFVTAGIQVAIPTDATTELFAKATNVYGNASTCSSLTFYTHTTQAPLAPVLGAVTPASPNNVTNQPVLTGDSFQNPASPLPATRVVFYDSGACVANIGEGTPGEFSSTGIRNHIARERSFDCLFQKLRCSLQFKCMYICR